MRLPRQILLERSRPVIDLEPPFAVLVSPSGRQLDVSLADLPEDALPGDTLLTPWGPVVGERGLEAVRLRERLDRLVVEPPGRTRRSSKCSAL